MPENSLSLLIALSVLFVAGAGLAWVMFSFPTPAPLKKPASDPDLKKILDSAPMLIWMEQNGTVLWRNSGFENAMDGRAGQGIQAFDQSKGPPLKTEQKLTRVSLADDLRAGEYQLYSSTQNDAEIYFAIDASPLIESEKELQRFIQTLTETFAHLPIGLAVFDKKRDLSLFNPALCDLLDAPADWLIRRPSLMSFLDRLRSEGIMPEPINFQSTRQEFKNLESGAVNGTFQAEWTLASGRIYRVVGRPHIMGGLVLLFEDISQSVMLERQYRAELGQLYAAFDSLADGVAIFDPAGELVFVNDAFDEMWQSDLAGVVSPVTVIDFSRMLQDKCEPTPAWGDFREFVMDATERSQWQSNVLQRNGQGITVTFSPIAGGQVFCEFKKDGQLPALAASELQIGS